MASCAKKWGSAGLATSMIGTMQMMMAVCAAWRAVSALAGSGGKCLVSVGICDDDICICIQIGI